MVEIFNSHLIEELVSLAPLLAVPLLGVFERHHIIPKMEGGRDEEENIAILTRQEHALAHLELAQEAREEGERKLAQQNNWAVKQIVKRMTPEELREFNSVLKLK